MIFLFTLISIVFILHILIAIVCHDRILEVAMLKKYGPTNLAEHYAEFDTICDATQVKRYVARAGDATFV